MVDAPNKKLTKSQKDKNREYLLYHILKDSKDVVTETDLLRTLDCIKLTLSDTKAKKKKFKLELEALEVATSFIADVVF